MLKKDIDYEYIYILSQWFSTESVNIKRIYQFDVLPWFWECMNIILGYCSISLYSHSYSQPHMQCCCSFPPFSLHVLGTFSLFQISTSHSNWNNMVYMRDLSQAFIMIKFIKVFSQKISCGFNIERYCSYVCAHQWCSQTLVEICRNISICDVSGQWPSGKIYLGFYLIPIPTYCGWHNMATIL